MTYTVSGGTLNPTQPTNMISLTRTIGRLVAPCIQLTIADTAMPYLLNNQPAPVTALTQQLMAVIVQMVYSLVTAAASRF